MMSLATQWCTYISPSYLSLVVSCSSSSRSSSIETVTVCLLTVEITKISELKPIICQITGNVESCARYYRLRGGKSATNIDQLVSSYPGSTQESLEPTDRYWHDFFITRLIDHRISSGRWQMNRTQNRNNFYFLDIVHIIIVSMLFKIFGFFKYQKTHVLADFVHELKDIGIVDFLAKI